MPTEDHFRKLERMYLAAPINGYYDPTIQIDAGAAVVGIAIRTEFFHAAHAVHGSVYFKAMDDAAFFAANSVVADVFVLTTSFNVYFTRPVSSGTITATGMLVHQSRRLLVAEAALTDSDGNEIGRGSGSFMQSKLELTADIGYL